MIFSQYVNHAHNEYLEVIFEGGVIAAIGIIFYLIILAVSVFGGGKNTFQKAALLSIVFLLVHSFVDYPLRTMALALTFAYLNAIVFHTGFGRGSNQEEVLAVERSGGQLLLPIEKVG